MTDKERIDSLLQDLRELKEQAAAIHDPNSHSMSFFSRLFDLTRKILHDLYALDLVHVDMLRLQMEEYRELIETLPIVSPAIACQPADTPASGIFPDNDAEEISVEKKPTLILNEMLEKKQLSDFRKAFSLNDRFRFRRELFNGDEEMMNRVIADLNNLSSYEASVAYLRAELKWDPEEESAADFIKLLEKRFQ